MAAITSKLGSTSSEAASAKAIMTAVSKPNVAKIGDEGAADSETNCQK